MAAGHRILVRPGSLPGLGAGGSATPVLADCGSAAWSKRVLVRPRDGYGTVTVDGHARISAVHGVVFAGLQTMGWRHDGSINGGVARILIRGSAPFLVAPNAATLTGFVAAEVVVRDQDVSDGDVADIWTRAGVGIDGVVLDGCYLAPHWRPSGSSAHTDTIQFEDFSAYVTNALLRDCAIYGSSNAAIQVNALDDAELRHCYIAETTTALSRYPVPEGAEDVNGHAINGSPVRLSVTDGSVVLGNVALTTSRSARPLELVADSSIRSAPSSLVGEPVTGAWHVDPTLDDATHPHAPPYPDDAYLASIWA